MQGTNVVHPSHVGALEIIPLCPAMSRLPGSVQDARAGARPLPKEPQDWVPSVFVLGQPDSPGRPGRSSSSGVFAGSPGEMQPGRLQTWQASWLPLAPAGPPSRRLQGLASIPSEPSCAAEDAGSLPRMLGGRGTQAGSQHVPVPPTISAGAIVPPRSRRTGSREEGSAQTLPAAGAEGAARAPFPAPHVSLSLEPPRADEVGFCPGGNS